MKKQILFFQNQSNNLSKRAKSLPKLAMTFVFFMFFTTLSFSQTTVDCSEGPFNTTYCYVNNDTTQFEFTSTGGFPLNVFFNAGQVEQSFDELIVLDSDGVTDLNAATPYGNNGDLTGITYQSSGDTITIQISSDSVINCETNAYTPWDFDIWCQTCINPTVTFNTDGDCINGNDFLIIVDVSDLGSATELKINDDQGSPEQMVTTTSIATFGPYNYNTDVIMTVNDANDINCEITSNTISCLTGGPGSLFINAGDDITIQCDGDTCTDITAAFLATFESNTDQYIIDEITYDPPYAFNGLANSINTNIDDAWSSVEDLPFDFCFFTNTETQFQVGSNGGIRFDVDPDDTYNGWSFIEDVPNNTNETLSEVNVFTPVHDIDPSVNDQNEIAWEILGAFPNRVLVVSYYEVPYFGCNETTATQMVVFYEFSNIIEIYMQDKPTCSSWNDGNAVLGIQNNAGNIGYVPPGRNTSDSPWTAANEAWSFSPNGEQTYVFEWLNSNGDFISNDPTINVCPDVEETYTAQITYTNCNGDVVTLTDDVTVSVDTTFSVNLGGDQDLCDESSYDITAEVIDGDSSTASYEWNTGDTTPTITVTASGEYFVDVIIDGCTIRKEVTIQLNESPLFDLGQDIQTCFELEVLLDASPTNMDPTTASYEWSLNGNIIPSEISPTLIITQLGTYSVIVSAGNCYTEHSIVVSQVNDLGVDLGSNQSTCFVVPIILNASPSIGDPNTATYEWSLGGVTLPDTTATLDATIHGTYFVSVTIGVCTDTDSITLTPIGDLGVDLGSDFTTCFSTPEFLDATPDIGDPSTASYEWYLNNNLLVTETSSIINATEHGEGTYSVTVNLNGCTDTDSITLTPIGDLGVDLGSDFTTCFSTPEFLDATPSIGDPNTATYEWSLGGVTLPDTTATLDATIHGTYFVSVTIGVCTDTDSITLTPIGDLGVDLGSDFTTCFSTPEFLDATPDIGDPSTASYEWYLNNNLLVTETSSIINATEHGEGTYSVTVNLNGCIETDSIILTLLSDLNVSVNDDFKSCIGEEWTLTATTSEEEVNYQWYLNGDLIVGETNSTITFVVGDNFSGNENYSVVISRGTCLGTDDVNIELYNVSNCVITQGISPDATPGFNDYLDLEFLSDRVGGITNLQIFNRYGTIVFNKNNYINEWKGQDKNKRELPTGTYYYVIEFASTDDVYGDQTSGWIYLNRTGN